MTVLSIVTVLFATAIMGYVAMSKADRLMEGPDADAEAPRQRQLPKPWSTLVIAVTVLYCVLLLAGLSYAGWFHVA